MTGPGSEAAEARALRELPLAVFVRDTDGHLLDWDPAAELLFGWSRAEVSGEPVPFVSPDAEDAFRALDARLLRGEAWVGVETGARTKDGRLLEITLSGAPIRDEHGAIVGSLGLARELTGSLKAERESGRFFELSPDMLCIVDLDGYFVRINPAWERTLGYSAAELYAQPLLTFVHPDEREQTQVQTERRAEDPTPLTYSNRFRAKDGSYRWLQWISVSDRQRRCFYAIARDVTELRRTEEELARAQKEAERANLAKNAFLSRVSHELRTPLNAILGFGQLLEMDKGLSAEQADSVDQILEGGRHLLRLIDEMLDISRIESGRLTLSLEPVEVDSLVAEALALMAPLAAQREISVEAPKATGGHVFADRQRLKQALLNLLSNAVKFNRDGGEVRVTCEPAGPTRLRITVVDTGWGVPEDQRERLFVPFDRLDAAERGVDGTGLGLALTRRLVEAMGGTNGVESTLGEGSSFWVEFPLVLAPSEVAEPVLREHDEPALPRAGDRTILYIEDNVSNLRLIERILGGDPGPRVLAAMQGRLGIDLAREYRPDLILLDLHLPDLSGEEVLGRLRADELTRSIPVVVISADAAQAGMERLLAAGARAYLTKPLDVQRFLAAVEDALGSVP